ncbi:MAG: hypothetical protein KGN16_10410 [Burkholderiales bacterium]|nr:hypothetical protein [Burkholderiales bacterium]
MCSPASPRALPGRWREAGGVDSLVQLDIDAVTVGMVVVGKIGEDWAARPELRWQAWPEDLEPMPGAAAAVAFTRRHRAAPAGRAAHAGDRAAA